ncbi:MAG: hypothetical protein JSU81_03920 [Candidatus Coatesbacteria bacterium]|nr:MAG: hypothetical protein JSU81_03920 [Candidatus Coatesbacteria bacterium]
MWKIIAAAAATAATAHGLGFGVGAFGGVALPEGDLAAQDGRVIGYGSLEGGDAGSSAAWGGKALASITPALGVEFAVAYHPNHGTKNWEEHRWLDEPKLTLVPITLGGRYSFAVGTGRVYVGAGGGYFLETVGLYGGWGAAESFIARGDVNINAPGAYVAAGLTYRLGKLELEAGPRVIEVWNKGEYDYTYEVTKIFPPTFETEVRSADIYKGFNDRFINVLVGVNYYFL